MRRRAADSAREGPIASLSKPAAPSHPQTFGTSGDPVERMLFLQRTAGNRAVGGLLAKALDDLGGNTPADLQAPTAGPTGAGQTRGFEAGKAPPPVVEQVVRSPGEPLAPDTQRDVSARFGQDFSSVRIHADATAAATARALHANAYTVGAHIAFADGRYQPRNPAGMRLLVHELSHVVQQRGGGPPPGPGQEQDAEAASRAVEAGEAPRVGAPSQVGIAAQPEESAKIKAARLERVMWFYHFYMDRLGYEYVGTGENKGRLVNPRGGHFVDVTFDAQSPGMVSVIVAGKSFEVSEYNFSSERFETRERHISMVETERKLSVLERIATGFSVTAKVAGGAALCAWGSAETLGFGAVAACGYGADLAASGFRELRGEDSRTLTNQAVSSGLSHLVGEETAQQLTNNAEASVNVILGALGAAQPVKPVVPLGPRPPVSDVVPPRAAPPPKATPTVIAEPPPPQAAPTVIESPTPQPSTATPKPLTQPVPPRPGLLGGAMRKLYLAGKLTLDDVLPELSDIAGGSLGHRPVPARIQPGQSGGVSTPQAPAIGTSRPAPVTPDVPAITASQPSSVPVNARVAARVPASVDAAVEAAFAQSAQMQVGALSQTGRVRTTHSGRQLASLDQIPLTADQREAATAVHGQTMTADHQDAWQNATNAREQAELATVVQLWNMGTAASQQQARDLARDVFNRHRARYWAAVRANPALRAIFEAAGMRFVGGNTTAPLYDLPDGTTIRLTLEHSTRLADDPTRALTGSNLQWVLADENSVNLEYIRSKDPFQR